MKRNILFLVSLFVFFGVGAQHGGFYAIAFKDKANNPYSLNHPEGFLSQRAIERRQKYNIPLDETDLPVTPQYVNELRSLGAQVYYTTKWFNAAVVFLPDTQLVQQILSKPFVASVKFLKPEIPSKNKKRKGTQGIQLNEWWSQVLEANLIANEDKKIRTFFDYGQAYNQNSMIAVDYLHSLGFTGKGMVIAVLDAGFFKVDSLSVFDSLRNSGRLLGTKDFVLPGGNVFERSTHGMAVLSLMAANVQGKLVGTAPHASYWLLRSEDANSEYLIEEYNWAAAAEFADSVGADVINSSLGYTRFDDSTQDHSYTDMDGKTTIVSRAATMAARKGILVVNAAGNSGNDSWHYIGAPADADSIISVGAVDPNGIIAYFSSRGPTSDGRIKPTVCAQGHMDAVITPTDEVEYGSGTSFASPVMAGAVTCLWQAFPSVNNIGIIDAVKKSAHKYTSPDNDYGYGIPNLAISSLILGGNEFSYPEDKLSAFVYPNPFDDEINLIVYSNKRTDLDFEIYNIQGKLMASGKLRAVVGYNYYYLPLDDFKKLKKSGVYILKLWDPYRATEVKLIKK